MACAGFSGGLEVHTATGAGIAFAPPVLVPAAARNIGDTAIGSFNLDTTPDLVVSGAGSGAAGKRDVVYYGTGTTWRPRAIDKDTTGGVAVLLGDFVGSGEEEAVFVGKGTIPGDVALRHVRLVHNVAVVLDP